MRNLCFICWILLLVDDVFVAVSDEVKTVIVMEGDPVTLNTNFTEIKRDDTVLWMFGDDNTIIAKMKEAAGIFSDNDDERFRDRLKLDRQTGSLTITNIRTQHTGLYQLKVMSTTEKLKKFGVTVRDEVQSVSLMEGDTVTLQTGVTKIQKDDQILWKFGDRGTIIADLNGDADAKWKDMIKLNVNTGDLTIRNVQTEHSGDYDLEIYNSSTALHKKFRIAVSERPPSSSWQTAGPVLAVVVVILIVIGIGICIAIKMGRLKVCFTKNGEAKTEGERMQSLNSDDQQQELTLIV
ncbi:uncharacterized protein LOC122327433 isoform X2 [Puntigrus tetrazona]|uniref:uncharacterized protein LOC122327433 isoform X2 n=1 Tax=Puntigrus tetrazona TaxID=1606681 RepID=UPI001C893D70|nr:uncharacterized protein LOC122327433 isoform X2 [Puntigrus tetrazona]